MVIRTSTKGPVVLPLRLRNRQIVDACKSNSHEAVAVELPILITIGAIPVAGIVVRLVGESHGDAVFGERPKLFNQTIVELSRPLAPKKRDNGLAAIDELRAISPAGIGSVSESDFFGITRIPRVFRETNFLDSAFRRKWGQGRACTHKCYQAQLS